MQTKFAPGLVIALFSLLLASASAQGPTFKILHSFAGGPSDGNYPSSGLSWDAHGNLYGFTLTGGADTTGCFSDGCGTAFKLTPSNGRWKENVLYSFAPATYYYQLYFPPVIDAADNVYGVQGNWGDPTCQCGAVFELAKNGNTWTQNVLHNFTGGFVSGTPDGQWPGSGLVQDAAGNLYGTTDAGGNPNYYYGTLYQFTPGTDGTWAYSIPYAFYVDGSPYAANPYGQLITDSVGNIYGTSSGGLYGYGAAFELSPSETGWNTSILSSFTLSYGSYPSLNGVVMDSDGNLYGVDPDAGANAVGTIYKLTPSIGYWNQTVLYTFSGGADGGFPINVVVGPQGALYGVTSRGGIFGYGNVFQLSLEKGNWKETVLHAFAN